MRGEAINVLSHFLQQRFPHVVFNGNKEGADTLILTTFFFTKMWETRNSGTGKFKTISRWTKLICFKNIAKLIIPINLLNVHWIAIVLDRSKGTIRWFDSMNGDYSVQATLVQEWWNYTVGRKLGIQQSSFVKEAGDVPTQLTGSNDCGIFTSAVLYDQAADPRIRSLPDPSETGFVRKWLLFLIFRGGMGREADHVAKARETVDRTMHGGPAGALLQPSL